MPRPTRRAVLGAGIAATGTTLLAASSTSPSSALGHPGPGGRPAADGPAAARGPRAAEGFVTPDGREVAAAEARRAAPGAPVRKVKLTAVETRLDLGGVTVKSWAYGDELPGRAVRATAGETLEVTLANHLPQPTTVHWHGLRLRNDMDGVPGVTQQPIRAGASFTYRFAVPHPGTYWFHPHGSVQLDRGLYAPLIVEDPKEPLAYDKEWLVVLDDWVDGVDGSTPDDVLAELTGGRGGMDHKGHGSSGTPASRKVSPSLRASGPSRMLRGADSRLLRGEAGDVAYPYYLINGRTADAPRTFRAQPGDRIRIRFINASGDTPFRVALGGHRMTVTHTDGYPVEHTTADTLLLAMGERYDVLVTAKNGTFPLTALAEGKKRAAMAVLRTGGGSAPPTSARPAELGGRLVWAGQLTAASVCRLKARTPDRTIRLRLTGSMADYDWGINRRRYDPAFRYAIRAGERVRLSLVNRTHMWHPMHLHGHTFALPGGGPRKDTTILLPGQELNVDFDADNPGLWMFHCHNVYHSEAGMMALVGYRR